MTLDELFDRLDEMPRTPAGLLARDSRGELRSMAIPRIGIETRRRFPELERRRNRAALLGALIEREERRGR